MEIDSLCLKMIQLRKTVTVCESRYVIDKHEPGQDIHKISGR
jgi:hypothetical protein